MVPISAVIITKNEEQNLNRCLSSLDWVDEIVIVDSGSTDLTKEIASSYGAIVIDTQWLGFGKTKQLAVDHAKNEWIISIDADEEIPASLKIEILEILKSCNYNGYRIPRKSFFLGKAIQHCGWQNDAPIRLYSKKHGQFNNKIVHESVEMKTMSSKLNGYMNHYTYPTIESYMQKLNSYTTLGALQAQQKGNKSGLISAYLRGTAKFFKMYFLKLGFLDGKHGFVLSCISGFGVTLKYFKLWEVTNHDRQC